MKETGGNGDALSAESGAETAASFFTGILGGSRMSGFALSARRGCLRGFSGSGRPCAAFFLDSFYLGKLPIRMIAPGRVFRSDEVI